MAAFIVARGDHRLGAFAIPRDEMQHRDIAERRYDKAGNVTHRGFQLERLGERRRSLRKKSGAARGALGDCARGALFGKSDLCFDALALAPSVEMKVDEDFDLGTQYFRHDRRRDVVDRAQRITARGMHLVVVVGGDEDDRDVRRLLPAANQRRGLQAVDAGHVDIEQDHGEIVREHALQRHFAR